MGMRHKVPINFTSSKVNLLLRLIYKSTYKPNSINASLFSQSNLEIAFTLLDSQADGIWDRTTKNAFPHERQKAPKMGPPSDAAGPSLAFKNIHPSPTTPLVKQMTR